MTAFIPPKVQYNVQTVPTDMIDTHFEMPVTALNANAGAYNTIAM